MEGKKRYAVLVGCNYANTPNELRGRINDVLAIQEVLMNRFGFESSNIELLTDNSGSAVMPTEANIKNALRKMIDNAKVGDVLYFHYSGHGTRIPPAKPKDPMTEAIVPCDFKLITDVDFRKLVNRLPEGASFTFVSDSCHSGGLIDKEKEQIGPSATTRYRNISAKPRMIPFESVLQQLSALTGVNTSDLAAQFQHQYDNDSGLRLRDLDSNVVETVEPDNGILLSGCQSEEYSADMMPEDGKAYGAFSNGIETILKEHPGPLSNRELVLKTRELLKEQKFDQHPCLYCSDKNADGNFLLQQ